MIALALAATLIIQTEGHEIRITQGLSDDACKIAKLLVDHNETPDEYAATVDYLRKNPPKPCLPSTAICPYYAITNSEMSPITPETARKAVCVAEDPGPSHYSPGMIFQSPEP